MWIIYAAKLTWKCDKCDKCGNEIWVRPLKGVEFGFTQRHKEKSRMDNA